MATKGKASSEASDNRSGPQDHSPVTSMNSNDVLLGRGTGINQYIGNQRFHELIAARKQEYNETRKHKPKKKIARDIVDRVHSLGGRFLRRDESEAADEPSSVVEGTWYVVDDKTALEKCKQALRERTAGQTLAPPQHLQVSAMPARSALSGTNWNTLFLPQRASAAPPSLSTSSAARVEALPLASNAQYLAQSPATSVESTSLAVPTAGKPDDVSAVSYPSSSQFYQTPISGSTNTTDNTSRALLTQKQRQQRQQAPNPAATGQSSSPPSGSDAATAPADDVAEFLLSAMALSGRTIFTEDETKREEQSMTMEERAALLADVFGTYCNVQPHKKAKRGCDDQDAIAFLVRQMRLELERIPLGNKRELVEAQRKCHSDEFNDEKLEHFLRCTGMDVQLAAQRFANYWKYRKAVFGPEKFAMRMTLSEAVCDDLVALEACVFCLLPQLDASGRQVQYLEPARHTREGYTSESLLRAIWYVVEVTAQESTDPRRHAIQVTWIKNMTIWDYDQKIYDRMHFFEATAWPIRICAFHVCCAPQFAHRILKPVMFALTDKESRTRTVFHDIPESEVIDALSTYGLSRDLLPTFMGGNLEFDAKEWIANRRAVELEEL